jgi:MoaA/NifB/PqqE/SkfB family radical SAM enzyme
LGKFKKAYPPCRIFVAKPGPNAPPPGAFNVFLDIPPSLAPGSFIKETIFMSVQQDQLKPEETEKRNLLKKEKPYVHEKIMKYDEKIRKGESIAILQFQYDYRCNFSCQHCDITGLRRKNKARYFTISDIEELSRQADEMGLAHLVITGGEPLVFPDFDDIVKAVDPQKFYITSDTNGWYLDEKRARHLKSIGVDKIQLSLDSLSAPDHDAFRCKEGSHERAVRAIDASLDAGLNIILSTVVTRDRVRSQEFIEFLEFAKEKGVGIFVTYAKPVGNWEGNYDVLVTRDDMDYIRELEKTYNVFTHLTPSYGYNMGCIAVKRMVSITKYGDVMPCPYIHVSLGNFFEEPLKDIIDRGLNIKYFGRYVDTCLIAEDRRFINEYETKRIYGKPVPVPYAEVFTQEDFISPDKRCFCSR